MRQSKAKNSSSDDAEYYPFLTHLRHEKYSWPIIASNMMSLCTFLTRLQNETRKHQLWGISYPLDTHPPDTLSPDTLPWIPQPQIPYPLDNLTYPLPDTLSLRIPNPGIPYPWNTLPPRYPTPRIHYIPIYLTWGRVG